MKLLELCYSRKQKTRNCSTLLFNSYLENWKPHGKKGRYLPSLAWGGSNYFFFWKGSYLPKSLISALASVTKDPECQKSFQDQAKKHFQLQPCSPSSPSQRSSESALAGTLDTSDEKVLPNASLDHFWKVLLLPLFKVPHGILTCSEAGGWILMSRVRDTTRLTLTQALLLRKQSPTHGEISLVGFLAP